VHFVLRWSNAMARRFSLLDGMIFVAATAAGLAVIREIADDLLRFTKSGSALWSLASFRRPFWTIMAMTPLLATWSLGVLTMRLRPPRPRLRNLLRQPGLVASALGSLIGTMHIAIAIYRYHRNMDYSYRDLVILGSYPAGYSVAAAWVYLRITGRWRIERSWLDRAGRFLGICWIGLIPLIMLFTILG
jgi:hypothetical protein